MEPFRAASLRNTGFIGVISSIPVGFFDFRRKGKEITDYGFRARKPFLRRQIFRMNDPFLFKFRNKKLIIGTCKSYKGLLKDFHSRKMGIYCIFI